jgi:hypothetical protein
MIKKYQKNRHPLFLSFLVIVLFLGANSVFALEVPLPGLSNNPTLPQYIVYFFQWGISIAGILALISFTIGAVGLIMSGDNPELAGNSKDRMKSAVLGLVLVAASFIIINTINPMLITPTLTPLTPVVITTPPTPGVYYYLQTGCVGDDSGDNTSSQDIIATPFNGNIKSIKIIDDPTNNINYGIIFHEAEGLKNGGMCGYPISAEGCHTVNVKASAADIFTIRNTINYSNYNIFGFGITNDVVTFYSTPYGWNKGANSGFKQMGEKDINPYYAEGANKLAFDYTNIDRLNQYKINLCPTFQSCPGSIKLKGNYLVALYSGSGGYDSYCQTFTADVPNLNVQPFIAASGQNIGVVDIYAIQ